MIKNQWVLVIPDLFLDKGFEYKVPDSLKDKISVGSLVFVPFGKRKIYAYVIQFLDEPSYEKSKIKSILSLSSKISLNPHLVSLVFWVSSYYCVSLASVFKLMIPSALRTHKYKAKKKLYYYFNKEKFSSEGLKNLKKKPVLSKLVALLSDSLLEGEKKEKKELINFLNCSESSFRNLILFSWLLKLEEEVHRFRFQKKQFVQAEINLNSCQQKALELITKQLDERTKNVLLYGVTGSGKTEVFLQSIDYCLRKGKQALVLVPEISLAYQTIEVLRARFGDNLAILHSGLSQMEKTEQWLMIENKQTPIVVGARSAIFAPIHNLGLIVVDEEHESAYKQESSVRYNARDLALFRGKEEKALVVLCSATPSLESYHRVQEGHYCLVELKRRVEGHLMPDIEIVDMRNEAEQKGKVQIFSQRLIDLIHKTLDNNMQVIIFINRRGYSPKIQCYDCGYLIECSSCDKALIYHKSDGEVSCNICDYRAQAPDFCPSCNKNSLGFAGVGIEKVLLSTQALFPRAKVSRLDSDIGRKKNLQMETLDLFRSGQIDILVGTQMIAKGLDFPKVALVGVIIGDATLSFDDFRANEKSFQLLTQVAGRSGRNATQGKVIVQSYKPQQAVFEYIKKAEYKTFYSEEIIGRELLYLPPFFKKISFYFISQQAYKAELLGKKYHKIFTQKVSWDSNHISSLEKNPIFKMNNHYFYTFSIFFKTQSSRIKQLCSFCHEQVTDSKVRVVIDVDPL